MRIVDFHTHTFPDHLAPRAIERLRAGAPTMVNYTDGTRNGLLASMRQCGIERSVVLAVSTRADQVSTINRNAAASPSPELLSFGTLFPGAPGFQDEIDYMRSVGIKGIKLHPEYQNFHVDDPGHFPMYEALQAAGLIVVFHAGWDPGPFPCDRALPPAIRTVVRLFPRLTIVAAHMGGITAWDRVEAELAGESLFLDTSAVHDCMPREAFMRLTRKHGVERILFATDSPWFDQAATIRWIDGMPLSSGEKERIFAGNALELLGGRSPDPSPPTPLPVPGEGRRLG